MTLLRMGDLVTEYTGQRSFVVDGLEQTGIDVDITARSTERIDHRVVLDQLNLVGEFPTILHFGGLNDPIDDRLNVLLCFRIRIQRILLGIGLDLFVELCSKALILAYGKDIDGTAIG